MPTYVANYGAFLGCTIDWPVLAVEWILIFVLTFGAMLLLPVPAPVEARPRPRPAPRPVEPV
jgi:hypothetical protein